MKNPDTSIPTAIAEYTRLHGVILQSVFCVDFPFGVVTPTRRRMDEITRQTGIAKCDECGVIADLRLHAHPVAVRS